MEDKEAAPGSLEKSDISRRVDVVLMAPQQSLNIGSVARAMMNLGFERLVLVKPEKFDLQKAGVTARWARPIVERAKFCESLEEALAPYTEVIGFGGRYDGAKFENISLPEWVAEFEPGGSGVTAILFGPEDRGLNTDEINLCRRLVRIPSTADYPSYNLAQAVLLVLYELSRTEWDEKLAGRERREEPTWNEFFHLERILDEILVETTFYRKGTPRPIPGVLKRLFRRMNPDKREMGILLAMLSRINKRIKNGR